MKELIVDDITLAPDEPDEILSRRILDRTGCETTRFRIIRRSLDARHKDHIVYRYRVTITVDDDTAQKLIMNQNLQEYMEPHFPDPMYKKRTNSVLIAGTGPAGLFAALRLLEGGCPVIILERGKPVEERLQDISILETKGILDPDSNVLFGEGGAGTYSDGKLTTRTHRAENSWFYKKLVEHGAPPGILYETRPHLGTDRLRAIMRSIREKIISLGGEIRFRETLSDLVIRNHEIASVRTLFSEFGTTKLILATGHSARDVYGLLAHYNIALQSKGFAAGIRIEHPVSLINDIQYGNSRYKNILPAADYRLVHTCASGRGVYSFCMCPGGRVINSSSEQGMLCTNGMSFSARDLPMSNAAIVVSIHPEDTGNTPFGGIELQRRLESAAFSAGGGGFFSPAQRISSFLAAKLDTNLPETSYLPGVVPSAMHRMMPEHIVKDLQEGLRRFNRIMPGFTSEKGILIGVETRTSSPVRIVRDEKFQSVSVKGLFPAGEGAGYAGGIVSSAVDGIRVADAILAME